jgi:CRISPR-associated endonuclease/helicase Cas3
VTLARQLLSARRIYEENREIAVSLMGVSDEWPSPNDHLPTRSFFQYWGKAQPATQGAQYHLLPYHCLDVAAVGAAWLDASPVVRRALAAGGQEVHARAWVLFFLALHDLGKFDIRFQAKAPEVLEVLRPGAALPPADAIRHYAHGPAGYAWFEQEVRQWLAGGLPREALKNWCDWLAAVAGHHGRMPLGGNERVVRSRYAPDIVKATDRAARAGWVRALEQLFLEPVGLNLGHTPPPASPLLAGFCSVCDWLGSDAAHFTYMDEQQDLSEYFHARRDIACQVLTSTQLYRPCLADARFTILYPDKTARQVQTLVDDLPIAPALSVIEAPTGSGKTEAALVYAARLLVAGLAESIVFALPTQATANAMLGRLEEIATTLFSGGANLILAHGKAAHHPYFDQLKQRAGIPQAQGREHAAVHCAEWLAVSRKRAFLGQIGICTVDQVLLSVLPVKHNFVRSFGLGKSVLIVDEVHAYDSYMLGLLGEALFRQRQAGGSAILLSATLPSALQHLLLDAWRGEFRAVSMHPSDAGVAPYPLITQRRADGNDQLSQVGEAHHPEPRTLEVRLYPAPELLPDATLREGILAAARDGAKVAVICNLVADAQQLAEQLRQQAGDIPVDLFHSRYRFLDRQEKEQATLRSYGERRPDGGRVLVATQVVEQSLDLDFDWLVTQICPVDLLFQRLGRLHRHRRSRLNGYEVPRCMVLLPENGVYGAKQEAVYCKAVLWRTEQCLRQQTSLVFPNVYRPLIEEVYRPDPWDAEPETITRALNDHLGQALAQRLTALRLAREPIDPFDDDAQKIVVFTREGEHGPHILLMCTGNKRLLYRPEIDLDRMPEWDLAEILDLEAVPVPNSWRDSLPATDETNRVRLAMREVAPGIYAADTSKARFIYDQELGLRMKRSA